MGEKCRSSPFQLEGGSKKFEDWKGDKSSRTGGVTDLGGITFAGGGQYPITCHVDVFKNKRF